jgi:hypothetical protein
VTATLRGRARVGVATAAALVTFAVSWLLLRDGEPLPASTGAAAAVSEAALDEVARSLDHPVYWAGPAPAQTYELTRTRNGSVFVRYLSPGVRIGDRRASYLTVATYPQPNGFENVSASAAQRGAVERRLDGGGVAVFNESRPTSVFFSYPGARYQVEVYDPSPGRALRLVRSGRVVPIR